MSMDIRHVECFTPLGIFINQYCRKSGTGLIVNNMDYILYDYITRKMQLIEEKTNDGACGYAQLQTLKMLDQIFRFGCGPAKINYWGVFVIKLPKGCTHVGPGVTVNNRSVTIEDLVAHLNFERPACPSWEMRVNGQTTFDGAMLREDLP